MTTRAVLLLALLSSLAAPAFAAPQAGLTDLKPRWKPQKDLSLSLLGLGASDSIILKIVDDAGAFAGRRKLFSASPATGGIDVSPIVARLDLEPTLQVTPLFDPLPREGLHLMRRQGESLAGEQLADLTQYFRVQVPLPAVQALVTDLLGLGEVENVYVSPRPVVPPLAPGSPAGAAGAPALSSFRDASPLGVDVTWLHQQRQLGNQPGAKGAGVTVFDIEYAWDLPISAFNWSASNHFAFATHGPSAPLIDPTHVLGDPATWYDPNPSLIGPSHGTAVLGITSADAGAQSGEGLASEADLLVVSPTVHDPLSPFGYANLLPQAIVLATVTLQRGDVILIEQQAVGPNSTGMGQFGFVPVEFYDAEFHAIRQATALGMHVVEAAGNGTQDFDSNQPPNGHPAYADRLDPLARDSGAIMVGAATSGDPHNAMSYTNRGFRVDAYSWGESVESTGKYPQVGGCTNCYTANFDGTSAASAIVAGVAAMLGGVSLDLHGGPLTPGGLRSLLRNNGEPLQAQPILAKAVEVIGRQPNLKDLTTLLSGSVGRPLAFSGGHDRLLTFPWTGGPAWTTISVGHSAAVVGDLDGDGHGDLMIGSPITSCAFVYSGRTGIELLALVDDQPGELFAGAVAGPGDLDGDGIPDLFVLTPGSARPNARFYSGLDGSLMYEDLIQTRNILKQSVRAAGDVNRDGHGDVLVGDPNADYSTGSPIGKAYVISGKNASTLRVHTGLADEMLGAAVCAVGDVNGDKRADYAIGTPHHSPSGGGLEGRVQVFSGKTGTILLELHGALGDLLGQSLASGVDHDGDGKWDLLVGAQSEYRIYSLPGGALLTSFNQPVAGFGERVSFVGDWDGDDVDDIAVSRVGAVDIRSGTDNSPLHSLVGSTGRFGSYLLGDADLDGDGSLDLIVGDHLAQAQYGRVYLYPSPLDDLDIDLTPDLIAVPPYLEANLPETLGLVSVELRIDFGLAAANRGFIVYASESGTVPGLRLNGVERFPLNVYLGCQMTTIPVPPGPPIAPPFPCVFDPFFLQAYTGRGGYPFGSFVGRLDSNGRASAQLGPFVGITGTPTAGLTQMTPGDVGRELSFVATTLYDHEFITNATTAYIIREYP